MTKKQTETKIVKKTTTKKSAEKTVDEYEDKEYRKKNIFWGILLVALIVGIYFYFN